MSTQLKSYVGPDEYLAREREADYKSEYLNGQIFAMAGATRIHNLLTGNAFGELRQQLKGKPCEVYTGDMRVRVTASGLYTYPDVVVVCGERSFEDDHVDTLLNPVLLIEVLSPSTESRDRIWKSTHYREIPSLAEYLLIAQDQYRIEQYVRQSDGRWLLTDIRSLDAVIELKSVGCSLVLRDIYDRVSFEA